MTRKVFCLPRTMVASAMIWMTLGLHLSESAIAQESVQVQIVNIPGVLPSPFISDLEDDVTSGRYQVHINYMSAGTTPIDLEFGVRLYKNRELLVDEVSEPVSFDPGFHVLAPAFDVIRFDRSIDQVLSSLSSSLQRTVLQTGALPEGDYRIELDARLLDDRSNVNIINGRAFFSVTHP